MSQRHSDGSIGDQAPLLLESKFASDLHLETQTDAPSKSALRSKQKSVGSTLKVDHPTSQTSPSTGENDKKVVLSTDSQAALRRGTQQLIPKNLAVASRPKHRYHTTVVTMPVPERELEKDKRVSAPDLAWEDHFHEDMEEEGGMLKRNLRNQSYRAAVKFFDCGDKDAMKLNTSLKPVTEEKAASPQVSSKSKKALTRKRNAKHGSFKDEPRLYQEIRERGLHASSCQDADDDLLDDFVHVEHPEPDEGIVVKSYRPAHITWSQLPQVQEMGILENISPEERKRQEAIFEIITSEYSYQHSLDILVRLFKKSETLRKTLAGIEHHHLFSNISDILEASKNFFEDLEKRHRDNPLINDISDIMEYHATNTFKPYIIYCSNEVYQQRTLQKLLASNMLFKDALKKIEMMPECGGLPMISFLILPMQRVTRLPLLMDTVHQKTNKQSPEFESAASALKAISKLVRKCNDGARRMEKTEQMYTIQKQLEFGKIKPFPLISASRWLLKRGELAACMEELSIFWKAFTNKTYYLFLFNDVLIVTKKKSEESYLVLDYATLQHVEVKALEPNEVQQSPTSKVASGTPRSATGLHLFRVLMKKNSEGREEQITLSTDTLSDRARWVSALQHQQNTSRIATNKEDLPQVEVIKAYLSKQPDELALQQADVVTVLQKVDGWYQGERLRDGERGWFPDSCAKEITNRVAVERNVRRMERLRKETDV
ncbi:rho guanine nucleotide exchange factor 16 [Erpetoichthys calabaricus]|uniref:Rho guanine nucleotide exchange factor (GEF) 16 n=1 Tax=Erpetoichthys calabaricus TaxID=27687 RepID=A0A8C4S3H3_ERPCA|nr:rho guanine nucleotide exchange factor 16 [Erpetoichthys calabaricus]XP_028663273.1 rho guanine nucleotide exchange factor 16 [Erpetoichthys calabaricus]